MKKIVFISASILLIAIIIWWRAPIVGEKWNKQTIYVWLLDTWYGHSIDNKAYAMWIDDDSSMGIFSAKKIADSLGVPIHFAVIADKMMPEVADSLIFWQRKGAGIILHGLRHEDWQKWNTDHIKHNIQQSKQRLYEQGFDTTQLLKIIIPPHGRNTRAIRKAIEHFGCKMMSGAVLVNPDRNVYQYGRLEINHNTNVATVKRILQKAYDRNAFVIFGTHSSIPEDFSDEKTKEILQTAKEMGYCFNINE